MPQLPTTGQANWGVPLNTFLEVSHDNTVINGGKVKPEAILTTGANKVLTTDANSTPTWVDKSSVGGASLHYGYTDPNTAGWNASQLDYYFLNVTEKKLKVWAKVYDFTGYLGPMVYQAGGKILSTGAFFTANNLWQPLIRLNTDGTKDTSFNYNGVGATAYNENGSVFIALQSDGKIILLGNFGTLLGFPAQSIARLNADGTKDTSFGFIFNSTIPVTSGSGSLNTIVVQSDNKILVGGSTTMNGIARLNADGTKDTSFSFTVGASYLDNVNIIRVQNDGKVLIAGDYSHMIIRLNANGTIDTSFNTGFTIYSGGFDIHGGFRNIFIQNDGKILLVADFNEGKDPVTARGGVGVIRLNADGTRDNSFSTGTGFDETSSLVTVLQSDGKILVGGYFTTYKGVSVNRIIRLNADGSRDNSFNAGAQWLTSDRIPSMLLQSDGKILVGGNFTTWLGTEVRLIVRLNADGSQDTSFNTGIANTGVYNFIDILKGV